MDNVSVLGIDLAKLVFHIVGMNRAGKVVLKKRVYRSGLIDFVANHPPVLIGLEACGGSSYWARKFEQHGHQVKLMAPQFVKPYVKSNKNDLNDAEAIAEAVSRPNMRFVSAKTIEQQDIQSLHRARERLVKHRTAIINEVRGLLGEYGIIIAKSRNQFHKKFVATIEQESAKLTTFGKEILYELYSECLEIEKRVLKLEVKLKSVSKSHPECQRLETIPGVGYLSSTAIIAAVGSVANFKNGREFAAFLGLVPRQCSTGGKERLLGISKRGNTYLRTLLIHGARASLRWVNKDSGRRGDWLRQLKERRGFNRTTVALANKNARVIWVLLARGEEYKEFAVS